MRAKATRFVSAAIFASVAFAQAPAEENLDRVLHFAHTETAQDLQEIATVIGAMTGIRQASTDTAQRTLALHATAPQIALAEWLFNELDRPANRQASAQPGPSGAKREYPVSESGDDVVRVFYLTNIGTVQELQEVATLVRSIGEIRRLFTYNAPRAVVLRGTKEQMALSAWLFNEMDQAASTRQGSSPGAHEFRMPAAGGEDVVRVFYLTHIDTVKRLQEIAVQVRAMTEVRRLFTYNAPRAMVLRGTANQIATADRLIQERDR